MKIDEQLLQDFSAYKDYISPRECRLLAGLETLRRQHDGFYYQLRVGYERTIILTNIPIARSRNVVLLYQDERVCFGVGAVDKIFGFRNFPHRVRTALDMLETNLTALQRRSQALEYKYVRQSPKPA